MNIKEIDRMLILEKPKYSFLFYAETILISNCFLFVNDIYHSLSHIVARSYHNFEIMQLQRAIRNNIIFLIKNCKIREQFKRIASKKH